MQRFSIVTAGGAALRALAPDQRLRILAVFRRAFYCQGDGGALLCIGPPGMGAGPLNAIALLPAGLDWAARGLRPGLRAALGPATLRVGDLCFDLRGARRWQPPPLPVPVETPALAAGLASLRAACAARRPSDGLAPGILPLAAASTELPPELPDASPLARTAWHSLRLLAGWLHAGLAQRPDPLRPPPAEAERLIGLGAGLTPSGDDCLAGMLIALHALGARGLAGGLGAWVLARAADRTHPIALGHLRCAAGGEGHQALHETLEALCAPGAPGLSRGLDALGRVGHSSGWDALAGVAAAIRAVVAASDAAGSLPARPDPSRETPRE